MTNINVLLVEDHKIVRQGLRALLESHPDIHVIGEANNGRMAVQEAAQLAPDVVVMDLAMPELNGVDAAKQILAHNPKIKILVLSMHGGEEYLRPALRAGVRGYLLKGTGLSELVGAIRKVLTGQRVIDSSLVASLQGDLSSQRSEINTTQLTSRQREILQLVAEGKSSPEIARLLFISLKTVEGHRSRIMDRLNIHDLAGLVRYAVRIGLVDP